MGFGARTEALHLFGQDDDDDEGASWVVVDLIGGGRYAAREKAVDDLFGGIPGTWEVTRIETRQVKETGDKVVVTGHIVCRPRGSWEQTRIPFAHVWTFAQGRVVGVRTYLEGVELRRIERLAPRPV